MGRPEAPDSGAVRALLAGLWTEILGEPPAGPEACFFRAGGDSMDALTMQLRVRRSLGRHLPVESIFRGSTFGQLVSTLEQAPILGPTAAAAPMAGPTGPERSQLTLDRFRPGASAYVEAFAHRVTGPLEPARLRRAFEALVARHPALRTTYDPDPAAPGGFQRRVRTDLPPGYAERDLREIPLDQRDEAAQAFFREQSNLGLDLRSGPLARLVVARVGHDDWGILLLVHHIAVDAWSIRVLYEELGRLYTVDGDPARAALPPAAAPASSPEADDTAWWVEHLADVAGQGALVPPGRSAGRPAALAHHRMPADTVRAVHQVAADRGCTPFAVLLAAHAGLVARCSGDSTFAVGTPVSLRQAEVDERAVGMLVQVLPVRVEAVDDPSFATLVDRLRVEMIEVIARRATPFDRIVPRLDAARGPVFRSTFVFHERPLPELEFAGLRSEPIPFRAGPAKWDAVFTVTQRPDGLDLELEHDPDTISPAVAARLLERYATLLDAVVAAPGLRLSEAKVLGPRERAEFEALEHGGPAAMRDPSIHAAFRRIAAEHGSRRAVSCGEASIDYLGLDRWSDAVARRLGEAGVGPGAIVAVAVPRSLDLAAALLGVLKAGAAYMPLAPDDPPARLRSLVDASKPAVVLVSESVDSSAWRGGSPALLVGNDYGSGAAPIDRVGPGDRAYVMFTSGSTGVPKAVEVPHRGVLRLVAEPGYLTLGPSTVFIHHSPGGFDASTLEIWGPLLNGGTLAILPPGPPDLVGLEACARSSGATALWLTAALFHLAVDELPSLFDGLQVALAGGDVVSPDHVRRLLARQPGLSVVNGYGPTENTTFTACLSMTAADLATGLFDRPLPVGRPVRGTVVRLLDEQGRRVPLGSVGELCTGGDGLALGYLGRPDLTAERFVADPLGPPGARLYRTGDLARWRDYGTLDFLGRADRQVKISGVRIEPGEVECALRAHPGVREAVVSAHLVGDGGGRLAAHVVPEPGAMPDAAALRDFLRARLPEVMIPASITIVEALPRTANGKVDRARLQEQPAITAAPRRPRTNDAPRGWTETRLSQLWADVLECESEQLGTHDDFFDSGGDSLAWLRLGLRIEEEFGVRLPLASFSAPTISALARAIEEHRPGVPSEVLVPMRNSGSLPPVFFVPGLGGHMVALRTLSHLLGPDRPVYGLQPSVPSHNGNGLEGLAASLVESMLRVEPDGPYHLAGFSAGGRIAFEMARQLQRSGRSLGLLGLLDSYGPGYPPVAPARARLWLHARRLVGPGGGRHALDLLGGVARRLRGQSQAVDPSDLPGGREAQAWREADAAYRPESIEARLTIFRATIPPRWFGACFDDPTMGWGPLARGGVEIHPIPGDHYQILRAPAVERLARELAECLDRADACSSDRVPVVRSVLQPASS